MVITSKAESFPPSPFPSASPLIVFFFGIDVEFSPSSPSSISMGAALQLLRGHSGIPNSGRMTPAPRDERLVSGDNEASCSLMAWSRRRICLSTYKTDTNDFQVHLGEVFRYRIMVCLRKINFLLRSTQQLFSHPCDMRQHFPSSYWRVRQFWGDGFRYSRRWRGRWCSIVMQRKLVAVVWT